MTDPGGGHAGGFGDNPDLEEPPGYIEGSGGGAAFPVGSLSDAQKAEYDQCADLSVLLVSVLVVGAAGSGLWGPAGAMPAVVFGISAGAIGVLGYVAGELAEDPPQPNYARPVEFRPRVSNPPQTTDPALEPFRAVIQQGIFASVTARGYLDAIERLQGAQQADDLTWALVHRGFADLALQQLIFDLANNGAALFAAGNALKGSQFDLALEPGMGGAKQWIEDKDTQDALAPEFEASGFTRDEMKRVIAFFKSDPTYNGPSSTLSAQLIESGEKIHATAMRIFELP